MPTYYDPKRRGMSALRVCVNNVTNAYDDAYWNPFISVAELTLRAPGPRVTTATLRLDAHPSHRAPGTLLSYRLEDGDNVKIYADYGEWQLIWQGFVNDPNLSWAGDAGGWRSGMTVTASDYRALLARIPFRTAAHVTHTWKLQGTDSFEESGGDIIFAANVLANGAEHEQADIGRGFSIRFNAKQQFDEAVPVSGNLYQEITDTGETDPTGAGKWFYINRTVPELIGYIIRNSSAEIVRALPAGLSIVFDGSYEDIGSEFVPDEIAIPDGTSVLDVLNAVLETTGTWTIDINPSYYDGDQEIHQPQIVFFNQAETTHQYRAWWAGPDAAAAPGDHPYNVVGRDLATRKMPAANRIIGLVTGGGQFVSDALSYSALRNRSSQPSLYVTTQPDIWETKPGQPDYVRTYQHNGRIVAGYVKVCMFCTKTMAKATIVSGTEHENDKYTNWNSSPEKAEGYEKTSVRWQYENMIYELLVKPQTQVLSLQLGPKTTNKQTGSTYTHKATLRCKSYIEFADKGKRLYLLTRIGPPKFLFDKRVHRHRTDRDDASGKQPGDPDFNPTPFGIIPSERYAVLDTLLPVSYKNRGALPALNAAAPDDPDSYCTEAEIDKPWAVSAPWRTGSGAGGSGRVITDLDFVQVQVSGLRFDSNGAMDPASLARWNAGIALCTQQVHARFAQRSKACTDGTVSVIHDAILTRAHIDYAQSGVLTPLQLRVNLCTGAPTGTDFERWQEMAATLLQVECSESCNLALTLNDTPVIPGVSTRRARLPRRKMA